MDGPSPKSAAQLAAEKRRARILAGASSRLQAVGGDVSSSSSPVISSPSPSKAASGAGGGEVGALGSRGVGAGPAENDDDDDSTAAAATTTSSLSSDVATSEVSALPSPAPSPPRRIAKESMSNRDYFRAWDKFDVDSALSQIDSDSDSNSPSGASSSPRQPPNDARPQPPARKGDRPLERAATSPAASHAQQPRIAPPAPAAVPDYFSKLAAPDGDDGDEEEEGGGARASFPSDGGPEPGSVDDLLDGVLDEVLRATEGGGGAAVGGASPAKDEAAPEDGVAKGSAPNKYDLYRKKRFIKGGDGGAQLPKSPDVLTDVFPNPPETKEDDSVAQEHKTLGRGATAPASLASAPVRFAGIHGANMRRKQEKRAAATEGEPGAGGLAPTPQVKVGLKTRRRLDIRRVFDLLVFFAVLAAGFALGKTSMHAVVEGGGYTGFGGEGGALSLRPSYPVLIVAGPPGDKKVATDDIDSDLADPGWRTALELEVKELHFERPLGVPPGEFNAEATSLLFRILSKLWRLLCLPYDYFIPKTVPSFFVLCLAIRIPSYLLFGTSGFPPPPPPTVGSSPPGVSSLLSLSFLVKTAKGMLEKTFPKIFLLYGLYRVVQNDVATAFVGFLLAIACNGMGGGGGALTNEL